MKLTSMSKAIHLDNTTKGFYDDYINCSVDKDYVIMKQLLLIITEIAEATEELRKNGYDKWLEPNFNSGLSIEESKLLFEERYKDKFQDEIADTMIRLLDLCGFLNIDIDAWIAAKLEYNKLRPYKHGKKY